MSAFDINGRFFRGLTKAGDFFILAVLVVVFSLPVVTLGASLTAGFYVALKSVKDEEGYIWRSFWKSWKQNLKQSIVIELLIAVVAFVLIVDVRICYNWASTEDSTLARMIMFVALGCLMVVAAVTLFVFPVLAKFDNSIIKTLKNSLILCMHHLPQTIVMLIITYGLTYFSLQYFTAFIVTIPMAFYVNAYILSRIFGQYVSKLEDGTEVAKDMTKIAAADDTDDTDHIEDMQATLSQDTQDELNG